jgi:hypothetical protein
LRKRARAALTPTTPESAPPRKEANLATDVAAYNYPEYTYLRSTWSATFEAFLAGLPIPRRPEYDVELARTPAEVKGLLQRGEQLPAFVRELFQHHCTRFAEISDPFARALGLHVPVADWRLEEQDMAPPTPCPVAVPAAASLDPLLPLTPVAWPRDTA